MLLQMYVNKLLLMMYLNLVIVFQMVNLLLIKLHKIKNVVQVVNIGILQILNV